MAHSAYLTSLSPDPAEACYNLLVRGFRAGQLSLAKEVPGLARLADPYDRTANASFGVLDLSYYKGKLYLYFGPTPAVVLFWPYVAVTGHYLLQKDAAVIFCVIGFLTGVGLLYALWRRYFANVNVGVVMACALAFGLATLVPVMLARSDVYEVSISCGYAMTMLALAAIWKALHDTRRRGPWLAAASLAYGLALGARPSLLPGAMILLVPVLQAWRERRKVLGAITAATIPIVLIGLGLMLYNFRRFDNPFEFGIRYQLSGDLLLTRQFFSLRCLWFNFRIYFLEPASWAGQFPFVHDITAPPRPTDYGRVENPFGVLTNIPVVWLALAVSLAWRSQTGPTRTVFRWFVAAVILLFWAGALTLCFFCATCLRYQVEFVPALVFLAVIGILGLESKLASTSKSGPVGRLVWRCAARWGWALLLGFSVVFNLLASAERRSESYYNLGNALLASGRGLEAIVQYEKALHLKPDDAQAHNNVGIILEQLGRLPEAVAHYGRALQINPRFPEAHNNLGGILAQQGQVQEAIGQWETALQIRTNYFEARYNLARGFALVGEYAEAATNYQQALVINPDSADAHNNLGNVLIKLGRLQEALEHYELALRLNPDSARIHYNFGVGLEQAGRVQEAMEQYTQSLQIDPDSTKAQEGLARLRSVQ
jgi:Flp pilus assembly protein TadD